jgi:SpoVK/Ycf46/Vps4 family AAA+-type ATPase
MHTFIYITDMSPYSYIQYIAATNRLEDIDPAMVRRFESRIYVGVPEHDTRVAMVLMLCIYVCMYVCMYV